MGTVKSVAGAEQYQRSIAIKDRGRKERSWKSNLLVKINLPDTQGIVNKETFTFSLNKDKLRIVMRKEGRYLLRSNLTATDP